MINYQFIPAGGLHKMEIGGLWDNIALSDLEEDVLAALRIIAPKIDRLTVIGDQEIRTPTGRRLERIPIVRTAGNGIPLPIRSLGEGMNRMLGLALALANSKEGLMLVDEIDSGLHYSVQTDTWRLLFQMAHRLNAQVFATTHSWDCIEAFQKAAQEAPNEEAMLIRLGQQKEGIVSTLFDKQELAIAAREQIEVR